MTYAPIALFVYNRPIHTRQTVESLKRNELSKESDLIIFSDAPKSEMQLNSVLQVRQYIQEIIGFKSVTIVERESNFGLARSIIDGVTRVVSRYGRIIVLEDDLLTSPYFLRYMNEALTMYEHDETVMHISGSKYPIKTFGEGSTFFFRVPLCWGWATWRSSWKYFSKDISVIDKFDCHQISDFSFDGNYHYWEQLQLNKTGKMDTWFVFWYATLFLQGGVALFPQMSLVRNVGMDGSGVHCGSTTDFDIELSPVPIELNYAPAVESVNAALLHMAYFKSAHKSSRGIMNLFRRLNGRLQKLVNYLF